MTTLAQGRTIAAACPLQRRFWRSSVVGGLLESRSGLRGLPESQRPRGLHAATEPLPTMVLDALNAIVGADKVSTGLAVREQHARDESYHADSDGIFPPHAVVFPSSTEQVAEIVKLCAQNDIAIVPSGACTSLEGHLAALKGGVSVNMRDMKEVLEVNASDMDCRVQAGVTRIQLNEFIRDTGLFFPVDPGADASFGGMASTRASGTNAVRYGTMRDNVLGITAVLADGSIVRTGGRARKSSTGYDLTRLLIGSEGTLGIITEVTIRLHGQPEAISSAVCEFESLHGAVDATIAIIQCGIPVARVELLDSATCDAVNKYSKMNLAVVPTLFFEFHGSSSAVAEQAQQVGDLVAEFGGSGFKWSASPEERSQLWKARHDAYYASIALRPGCKGMPTDACVPISRLADCILETEKDLKETGLVGPMLGHVGDGNFHMCLAIDVADKHEVQMAKDFGARLARRAISMGGTCSGEHGVGYGKLPFLDEEHGPVAVQMMRSIKSALDPKGLLNPGKMGS
eukprot:CAMPEP_0181320502 /NCGR_PEP_ID=MMETSP1101-20121128/18159_1 /TAXON_ID=46948 /ORGANISM="Rhodomonas abbreviata, Strain Caron Lab Isolate" /LENGTH=514 /DNA_ID=CAMNT_0023428213 /DNA_START=141 /DNA_END=1685 /DNA_ORIENTATION=+